MELADIDEVPHFFNSNKYKDKISIYSPGYIWDQQ